MAAGQLYSNQQIAATIASTAMTNLCFLPAWCDGTASCNGSQKRMCAFLYISCVFPSHPEARQEPATAKIDAEALPLIPQQLLRESICRSIRAMGFDHAQCPSIRLLLFRAADIRHGNLSHGTSQHTYPPVWLMSCQTAQRAPTATKMHAVRRRCWT